MTIKPFPWGPVGPCGPWGPVGPVTAGPVGPWAPVCPLVPVGPCGPVGPVGPVGPWGPVSPTGPVVPVRPSVPSQRVLWGPVGPVAPWGSLRAGCAGLTLFSSRACRSLGSGWAVAPGGRRSVQQFLWSCRSGGAGGSLGSCGACRSGGADLALGAGGSHHLQRFPGLVLRIPEIGHILLVRAHLVAIARLPRGVPAAAPPGWGRCRRTPAPRPGGRWGLPGCQPLVQGTREPPLDRQAGMLRCNRGVFIQSHLLLLPPRSDTPAPDHTVRRPAQEGSVILVVDLHGVAVLVVLSVGLVDLGLEVQGVDVVVGRAYQQLRLQSSG